MKHAFPKKTGKTIIWNPTLSTNPPISEQFFHVPHFVQTLKTRPPLILGGREETMLL